ncbi:MAG TPA: hypothetical protein V6D23_01590 [Candidatus Obscuribacterales bacterium]
MQFPLPLRLLLCLFLSGWLGLGTGALAGPELKPSPTADKCFSMSDGGSRVCMGHPLSSVIDFRIEGGRRQISARARLSFEVAADADEVCFFLDPAVKRAVLDGKAVSAQRLRAPGNQDWITVLALADKRQVHSLELEYEVGGLTRWGLNWQPFNWVTDFSDSSDARFINAFAPASFEADRYPMSWNFSFTGIKAPLRVYTNASGVQQPDGAHFRLNFDARANLAGPYFEFSSKAYRTHSFSYQGYYQPIPVTIYLDPGIGRSRGLDATTLLRRAETRIRTTLRKFEASFGPYAFPALLVKVYSLQTGDLPLSQEYSMEYAGAVVSRMELIPHEICHQWFGRGASPRDGQAGFVDELICDWYDYGNPVASTSLAALPPAGRWTLRTPEGAYHEGRYMAGLAWLFRQQQRDVLASLRSFYRRYRQSSYGPEDFFAQLEADYPGDLQDYFRQHVYGGQDPAPSP